MSINFSSNAEPIGKAGFQLLAERYHTTVVESETPAFLVAPADDVGRGERGYVLSWTGGGTKRLRFFRQAEEALMHRYIRRWLYPTVRMVWAEDLAKADGFARAEAELYPAPFLNSWEVQELFRAREPAADLA